MFECIHCKIKINSESVPVNCPGCGNATGFINTDYPGRVCSLCDAVVFVNTLTGVCPDCGQLASFTEPESEPGNGTAIVDRYAGKPVRVDPNNVLVNDPEMGFTDETERNATPDE